MAEGPPSPDPPTRESSDLTPRELQVAIAVAKGMTTDDIARQLDINKRAVDFRLERIREKLSASLNVPIASLRRRDIHAWIVSRGMPSSRPQKDRRAIWIALRTLVWSPAILTVLMFFVTPTYFRPMFENFIGLVLLAILVGALLVGFGLVEVAIRLFRKGRVVIGVLALVGYSITGLLAYSIVLLGPAALILMKPRS